MHRESFDAAGGVEKGAGSGGTNGGQWHMQERLSVDRLEVLQC